MNVVTNSAVLNIPTSDAHFLLRIACSSIKFAFIIRRFRTGHVVLLLFIATACLIMFKQKL